jgi:hypothetical protein
LALSIESWWSSAAEGDATAFRMHKFTTKEGFETPLLFEEVYIR